MSRPRARRGWLWQGGAVALVGGLTVALTQNTTTAAFTGQTVDTVNQVVANNQFCTVAGPIPDLLPTADTAVYEATSGTSYFTAAGIGIKSGAGVNAYSYIRFNLPSVPAGCVLTSAVLRVYASQSQAETISVSRASVDWNASTTWSTPGKPVPAGTPVNLTVPGGVGYQQVTVTTLTQELMAGPNYGFMLKDPVDNAPTVRSQTWDSAEGSIAAQQPRLTLTWG